MAFISCRPERNAVRYGVEGSRAVMALLFVLFLAVASFAAGAPSTARDFFRKGAYEYAAGKLPTAEITCKEGLSKYPNDEKLQFLLDRIKEVKDKQKNENKKNDPKNDQNQDQNNQDQNQDQNQDKQNQDQNKDQQNQQNQDQNQNGDQSSSSAQNDQNQNQQNQGQNGQSSSSQGGDSSDSNGGADQQQQPEQSEGNSSDSNGSDQEQPQPLAPGELTPEEAAQLLKDFDEQNGERKPWKPVRGQVRPAKDW